MDDPNAFSGLFRFAWHRAVAHLGRFWIAAGTVPAIAAALSAAFAPPASASPVDRVVRAVVATVVSVVAVSGLAYAYALVRAPYEQRNALRQMLRPNAADVEVAAHVEWLRATSIPVYDRGRRVHLVEVCLALDAAGLSLWQKYRDLAAVLNVAFPQMAGEAGSSRVGQALYPLVDHGLVEEHRVDAIDHEPTMGLSTYSAGRTTSGLTGTRAVDRSYSLFRWTAAGQQALRLLALDQPSNSAADQK